MCKNAAPTVACCEYTRTLWSFCAGGGEAGAQRVNGLDSGSDEWLSCFASDDDRDALEITVGVVEDSVNPSGHGFREG